MVCGYSGDFFWGGEGFPLLLTQEENRVLRTHKCKFHLINSNGKPSQLTQWEAFSVTPCLS